MTQAERIDTPAADPSTMSGLELLRHVLLGDGRRPAIGELIGMSPVSVDEGSVVFALEPSEVLYNPQGTVHGGIIATLLDSAVACAVHSTLPAGATFTTLEIKVNYVRAITTASGRVRGEGNVIHVGGSTATAEGRVVDESGRLYAHATTTCLVRRPG